MALATEINNNNTENENKKCSNNILKEYIYNSEVLEDNHESSAYSKSRPARCQESYKWDIAWRNVGLMLILHSMALYGLYCYVVHAKIQTLFYTNFTTILFALGVTVGAHRLWSHRSFEARLPLRIFLMILNTASLQNDIYEWSRDHRVHHKFSDTDADPHNANRGFFFSHMGWLLVKKHPEVLSRGKTIKMDDIAADPVVRFQRAFYKPLTMLCTFYLPSLIPYYFWNENFYTAFYISAFRYAVSLHTTWTVNSAAHVYGTKPYDTKIMPRENRFVQLATMGEGYHNYHHVFPFDYSASEVSWTQDVNISTLVIDMFASLGLAYNLKKVTPKMIKERVVRTGDIQLNEVYIENKQKEISLKTLSFSFVALIFVPIFTYSLRKAVSAIFF